MLRLNEIIVLILLASSVPASSVWANGLEGEEVVEIINETFADQPKVAEAAVVIAECESTGLVHKLPDGRLLPNAEGGTASGVFQVLMRIHRAEFKRLGLNPLDDQEYLAYVRLLVEERGFSPWNPSKGCWGKKVKKIMEGSDPRRLLS